MGGLSRHAVSSWPSDITFRTYTKKEVEALSVKELTSPNIFYNESGSESPELGGLHDVCGNGSGEPRLQHQSFSQTSDLAVGQVLI